MAFDRLDNVNKKYLQKSVIKRLEALFLDNLGLIITNEQLIQVAKDPSTGNAPENWHQRLSELRTDYGYTVLSKRDDKALAVGEYVMTTNEKRVTAKSRKVIAKQIKEILLATGNCCSYSGCKLKEGDIDPVGGGKVVLQVDHKTAHDHEDAGSDDIENYQLLCGRHNVTKKNLWDDVTGKMNTTAILQFISHDEKVKAHEWLKEYFKD